MYTSRSEGAISAIFKADKIKKGKWEMIFSIGIGFLKMLLGEKITWQDPRREPCTLQDLHRRE